MTEDIGEIGDQIPYLLAGGESSRMGRDKRFLPIEGLPMLIYVIRRIKTFCKSVVVVVEDRSRFRHLESAEGVEVIQDLYPGTKALGGIVTALTHSKTEWNFVQACDMPFVTESLLLRIQASKADCDWVLPRAEGRLQTLCSLYSRRCLPAMEDAVRKGNLRITDLIPQLKTRIVPLEGIGRSFQNINTPEEYQDLNDSQGVPHAQ
jgi:molybdenum cofactor guanylyltransferase